ncbi:anthranilate 1,2-dioxygenase ferredoxin subunit AndAb [Paraburkholderia terrae]|uniref:anthranilate 1,2-dioxygenase ferredoxin subunit AndAb n=1 Tax=Paraburkholderia TaxID=1822464 RepID=UPI00207F3DED|nr:anthranilate 1,2-dioxygenase ferredoxin subunit AndAb [Paraburkholderia terrae]BEU21212.1 anthranilate 1,2-dioxygenase ferredoxin subunit AndAb [Paraburkholderia sp. 22B1P]GJH06775.1 non-heme iron oxygenase ferredoxin subunit [Paraburkholderia terrae]GJH38710.1 non-heme iron oxygenase ferredoxin subunit [Paraburkholderia hospita]
MTEWHRAAACADVEEDTPMGVTLKGVPVALFKTNDGYFALHDLCTHGAARLSEGFVEGGCVECPLHQGLFDLKTGAPRSSPVVDAVKTYPVRLVDGQIEVCVETGE